MKKMVKKFMTTLSVAAMLTALIGGGVSAAQYEASYQKELGKITADGNSKAVHRAYFGGTSLDIDIGKFYFLNSSGEQETVEDGETQASFGMNNQSQAQGYGMKFNAVNSTDNVKYKYILDTTGCEGKQIYSKSANLYSNIRLYSEAVNNTPVTDTFTIEVPIRFEGAFFQADFTYNTSGSRTGTEVGLFRIQDSNGPAVTIGSGSASLTSTGIGTLSLNKTYNLGIVMTRLDSETKSKYRKSFYLDGKLMYSVITNDGALISNNGKFDCLHINVRPWKNAKADAEGKITVTSADDKRIYAATTSGTSSTDKTMGSLIKSGVSSVELSRYTIKSGKMCIGDVHIYSGNKYATEIMPLDNTMFRSFFVTPDIAIKNTDTTCNITVVGDALTADEKTYSGKAFCVFAASYDGGVLKDVAIKPMTVENNIVEADIEIDDSDDVRVMIFDSSANLKPLTALTKVKSPKN